MASEILADLVAERETDASRRLTPRRFTPAKSAKIWAHENVEVVKHLVKDRLGDADIEQLFRVGRGEGAIVEIDGHKHAVYRDEDDGLSVLSPVCPHLKCHVAWNSDDRSWDCPCHGSRFRTDGSVIEGPALTPLENLLPTLGDAARYSGRRSGTTTGDAGRET